MRVLVADPCDAMRADMVSMMERLRCDVVAQVLDGPSALAAFDDTHADLAILSVDLPGETGGRIACRLAAGGTRSVVVAGPDLLVVLDNSLLNDNQLPGVLEGLQTFIGTAR